MSQRTPIIAVHAFNGISPFHLSVPCLVFGEDRQALGVPQFEVRICAEGLAPLTTSVGMQILPSHDLSGFDDADILVVPSWGDIGQDPSPGLIAALRHGHARGALIVGLCLGSFAVAATGLLDGLEATTHWGYAEAFTERHPSVTLRPEVLYVDTGAIITSAGVAAGLDCCLHILRVRYGAEAATQVARRLVVSPHRQGGQAQFIERPVAKASAPDGLARAIDGVMASFGDRHDLDAVAAAAGLTRRTFTRRFQARFGFSFGEWLIQERVRLAQRWLETTAKPVDTIAFEAGFGSATSMRQHFTQHVHVSPAEYRRAFAG